LQSASVQQPMDWLAIFRLADEVLEVKCQGQ